MPGSDLEAQDAPVDGGVPVAEPGPYDGVEPDETSGGFAWYNDPLYPGNDVEPNAEWVAATEKHNAELTGEKSDDVD